MSLLAPVVVIPFYQTHLDQSEQFSLIHNTKILSGFRIVAVCPKSIAAKLQNILINLYPNIEIEVFDDIYFGSIAGYNRLLKTAEFYRRFSAHEYLLLLQTDAIVFSNDLEKWCSYGYSYIGAPWFEGFTKPTKPLKLMGVGNGGLSLRRIEDFISCLEMNCYLPNILAQKPKDFFDFSAWLRFIKHRFLFAQSKGILQTRINEDVYWGLLIPQKFSKFKVAPIDKACQFAFDAEPRYLFELNAHKLPFGCHAWERFDRDFWVEKFRSLGIGAPNPDSKN